MSFTVRESIVIDSPREDVWEYVANQDEWRRPTVLAVRKLTEGPPKVGTRYEDTVKLMGRDMTIVNELLSYDPPRSMSWKQVEETGPAYAIKGRYDLDALNGKTQFTLSTEYGTPGLGRLVAPFIRRRLANHVYPTLLSQLKDALEDQREGG
jgi:uncharacterized protein YndB with AHSA1/START domain